MRASLSMFVAYRLVYFSTCTYTATPRLNREWSGAEKRSCNTALIQKPLFTIKLHRKVSLNPQPWTLKQMCYRSRRPIWVPLLSSSPKCDNKIVKSIIQWVLIFPKTEFATNNNIGIFCWQIRTKWAFLNATSYLVYCCWPRPSLYDIVYSSSDCSF